MRRRAITLPQSPSSAVLKALACVYFLRSFSQGGMFGITFVDFSCPKCHHRAAREQHGRIRVVPAVRTVGSDNRPAGTPLAVSLPNVARSTFGEVYSCHKKARRTAHRLCGLSVSSRNGKNCRRRRVVTCPRSTTALRILRQFRISRGIDGNPRLRHSGPQ